MRPPQKGPITALAPWFGGKRTLAPRIVEQLGPHRSYWEPFCGSMAVLFSKGPSASETVNDLHGDLVNLARCVRDESLSGRLYWRLRRTLVCESLFRESFAALHAAPRPSAGAEPDPERAYHYFLTSWLGVNGVAGTARVASSYARRFTSNGGDPARRFLGAVESLPDWHERLRAVFVLSGDGIELCGRVEDKRGTVIYADPPYLVKGSKYAHDFAPEDHERLAAALCRFKETRVVVSYYEHEDLARLYPGWAKVSVAMTKAMVNGTGRMAAPSQAPEVLLVNGELFLEPPKES
jgi:DNA adenine methylase